MRTVRPARRVEQILERQSARRASGQPVRRRPAGRRALGGVGQRDEHEEQHQELGVAEVVFEHPGREHRDDATRAPPSRATGSPTSCRLTMKSRTSTNDEPQPDRERRQPALGGDLQRHVVQVRVELVDGAGLAVCG